MIEEWIEDEWFNIKEFVRAHSRSDDPDTSKAAAESQTKDHVTVVENRILSILGDWGMTDEEITDAYISCFGPTGQSSIRSRRNDLVLKGKIEATDQRRRLKS